jgi:hypothetical protein
MQYGSEISQTIICIVVVGADNGKVLANEQPNITIYDYILQGFGCGTVFRHPGCMDNRVLFMY